MRKEKNEVAVRTGQYMFSMEILEIYVDGYFSHIALA